MNKNVLKNSFVLDTHFRRNDLSFNHKKLFFVSKDVRHFKMLFINSLIKQGKKIRAEFWIHSLLYALKKHMRINMSQYNVIYYTFVRLRPLVTLRKLKLGRTLYHLPMWISRRKKNASAVRLLLKSSRISDKGTRRISMVKVLELVLQNLLKKDNIAFQQRIILHKEVHESMAFSHFLRWV